MAIKLKLPESETVTASTPVEKAPVQAQESVKPEAQEAAKEEPKEQPKETPVAKKETAKKESKKSSKKKKAAKPAVQAAAVPAPAAPTNGSKSKSEKRGPGKGRRAVDFTELPVGVVIGRNPVVKGSFKSEKEALRWIETEVPAHKRAFAHIGRFVPVVVKSKVEMLLDDKS